MASIVKRKNSYSIVYYVEDEKGGAPRQVWETRKSYKEAQRRKAQVENQLLEGTFIPESNQTMSEFLWDFVSIYGEKKWSLSAYDGNTGLIANYIDPLIGKVKVQEVTPKFLDRFYKQLKQTKSVIVRNRKPKNEFVSGAVIEKIHKLLKTAFTQAVKWEMISRNPAELVDVEKVQYQKRDTWTPETIAKALNACEDTKLYLAINLAFACCLREGEILGLQWERVFISDEDIANDDAHIYIDRELQRCSKRALQALDEKDIIKIFPPLMPNTSTRVVLKTPKTDQSVRSVWLPKTLAYILRKWRENQDELREYLGEEYLDNDLVIALPNGRPCEGRVLLKSFKELKETVGLPNVVFHSLRHSSTTYKLKINQGDLKATQGDGGWATMDMITKVYAHIVDDDRKIHAQKFESAFYSNPDLRDVKPPEPVTPEIDLKLLLEQLQQRPELANTLAQIINAAQATS